MDKIAQISTVDMITGDTTYIITNMDRNQIWRSAVTQAAKKARRALPDSATRIDKAVDLILHNHVELLPNGHARVASQTRGGAITYTIANGSCSCEDYKRAPSAMCKHRLARGIYVRAMEIAKDFTAKAPEGTITIPADDPNGEIVNRCEEDVPLLEMEESEPQAPAPVVFPPVRGETGTPTIPSQYLVTIQGRQHITYAGLLTLAHQKGLIGITVRVISVTPDCAIMEATATFAGGMTWTEIGDATPKNVNSRIAPHYIRMAATRAKARCLRDALCIDVAALEELE